jgi:hypothetical protein
MAINRTRDSIREIGLNPRPRLLPWQISDKEQPFVGQNLVAFVIDQVYGSDSMRG